MGNDSHSSPAPLAPQKHSVSANWYEPNKKRGLPTNSCLGRAQEQLVGRLETLSSSAKTPAAKLKDLDKVLGDVVSSTGMIVHAASTIVHQSGQSPPATPHHPSTFPHAACRWPSAAIWWNPTRQRRPFAWR